MMKVATYNLGDGRDSAKVEDLDTLVSKGVSIIGLQEASDRGNALDDFLDHHTEWRMYAPKVAGGLAVPILWDTREWKRLRLRTTLAVASRYVGPGAGPRRSKAKRINVVVLKHRHWGNHRRVLNTHFIASATRTGDQYDERDEHYLDHARVLAAMIGSGERMRRTIVTGDFNADSSYRGLNAVRATLINGWTRFATHGKRAIDHVLGPKGDRYPVPLSSDHHAVIAESKEL
jgi:endonuclease/exonuclease/phosphatase family metal-dependent hydrolase